MGLESKLDHYLESGLNCLLRGNHGVGKTTLVGECFERHGLIIGETALIFSAATIDPWVDFIGVPKEVTKDGKTYLDFIQPKHFCEDRVEAIFFDEFNRSHKKIRNSVLELIQFKSINGKKFNSLKVVWAAINPEDSEDHDYDIERLDPAQKDRFQVIMDVPYKPSYEYFSKKYGEGCASSAIDWWKGLPSKMKKLVSPRRLDYAVEVFKIDGDLADVLPHETSPRRLGKVLREGSPKQILSNLLNSNKDDELKDFLNDTNNVESCMSEIIKYKKHMHRCLPVLGDELLVSSMFKYNAAKDHIKEVVSQIKDYQDISQVDNKDEVSKYIRVLYDVCKTNSDKEMACWSSHTLSFCIPGFSIISEPKMTLSDLSNNILERYRISEPVKINSPSPKEKLDDFEHQDLLSRISSIKEEMSETRQTSERQKTIKELSRLVEDHHYCIDFYSDILKIANLFCERSQKKTIQQEGILDSVLYLSDWSINACAIKNNMNDVKNVKKLIRSIPHVFVKCIIGQIEENESFSIFSLNDRAKAFKDIMS